VTWVVVAFGCGLLVCCFVVFGCFSFGFGFAFGCGFALSELQLQLQLQLHLQPPTTSLETRQGRISFNSKSSVFELLEASK
jgi:hypothetical protein